MIKLTKPTSSLLHTVRTAEALHECGEAVSGHAQVLPTVERTPVHCLHNAVVMHAELAASHEYSE